MDAQGASGEVWRHPSHRQGETKATGSAPRGWPSHVKSGVLHIISLAHSRSLVPGVGLPRASVPASESPPRRIGCIKQSPQDATYPFSSLLQATLPAQNRRPKIAGLLQSLVLPANDDGSVATHRPSAGSRVGGAGGGSPSGPPGKGVPDTRNGSPGRGGEWWSLAHAGEPSPGYR